MRVTLPVAVLGLLLIPTIASMHGGNSDPSAIHACVGNLSKIVRIVGATGSCIPSPPALAETAVHWNVQGPAGTNGLNGTNGTNGTDGKTVTFGGYFLGNANGCPNGGAIYIVSDANNWTNTYVCNGLGATGGSRPDPPCFDNRNRYVDCGNGTVTDTLTGLIWLKQADCISDATYAEANQRAAALAAGACGVTDHSLPGDWRLPTKDEWSATIARAAALGCNAPSLTNDVGTGCLSFGPSSFAGVAVATYWSSSAHETIPTAASIAILDGVVSGGPRNIAMRVWPVRSNR